MLYNKKFSLSFIVLLVFLIIFTTSSSADTPYNPSGETNGVKIYLSPAGHYEKTGCWGFSENDNVAAIAHEVAQDLQSIGYFVLVGDGDWEANANSSNTWGAEYHVPIHTNANSSDSADWDCEGNDYSNGGTLLISEYGESSSQSFSQDILSVLDGESPGTTDRHTNDYDLYGGQARLLELTNTNAIGGYVETAFHTFGPDVNWLKQHSTVANDISRGIHKGTGANDCRFEVCMQSQEIRQQLEEDYNRVANSSTDRIELIERGYELNTFGKPFDSLATDINNLFKDEESIFNTISDTSLLNGVSINSEGTLIIDFKHFNTSQPSANQSIEIYQEIRNVIFKYPQVNKAFIQFDGSITDYEQWSGVSAELTRK
ncbi:hypothetical protein E3U55_02155 [Filobacillus milosensis]|uniref:Uncharacterized protein n=1 Tax=Filobacillus milosensis TaxID=94137 RepID=A0A4Y8ITS6_9BACI|nr:N-acetylmuramoyl-L-alanine amidase [Filobacillus milosensis]TFB24326.1 hypothetical protein E3U55_02155 [Filobacillus milosensis]